MAVRSTVGWLILLGLNTQSCRKLVITTRAYSHPTPSRQNLDLDWLLRALNMIVAAEEASASYGDHIISEDDTQLRDGGLIILLPIQCELNVLPKLW
jgi:hypothetical protein